MVRIADQSSFAQRSIKRSHSIPLWVALLTVVTIDAVGLGCAGYVANLACRLSVMSVSSPSAGLPAIGVLDALIFCLLARAKGSYRIQSIIQPGGGAAVVVQNYAASLVVLTLGLFALKTDVDNAFSLLGLFAVFGLGAIIALRKLHHATILWAARRGAVRGRPVVAIGEFGETARLSDLDLLRFGIDVVGCVALTPHSRGDGFAGARQNQLTQAIDMARRLRAQEFALLIPWNCGQTLTEVLDRLRASPLPARLYADRKLRDVLVRQSDGAVDSHFSVRLQRAPLSRYNRWVKRLLDLVISCLLLLLLSPLLLATAVLVKLDSPGPVMFRQRRGGFDGREFLIFKFRTMFVLEDGAAIRQVSRNDRRVTRIGRVLRRTSIDELPQLLNVLRGDMSLVGPRPHAVAHDEAYRTQIDSYAMRRHVMPGLTGAAQVAGLRGETPHLRDMAQRVELDLWYVDNWSLTLDLRILAQTFVALLEHPSY